MSAKITFFSSGDCDIISGESGVSCEVTSSSPAAIPSSSAATPIDHAALTAHDKPRPSGEIGREAAG